MDSSQRAVAIVGLGAILPEALDVPTFWNNILRKRYSITEVPPERWSIADYYDPDPAAPDKTYSKIGAWVSGFEFDWKQFHIPPRVVAAMDPSQQWAVSIAAQALSDYGYPRRALDTERTAVVLGTVMGGEQHYRTAQRVAFPDYARALDSVPEFQQLPGPVRAAMVEHWHTALVRDILPITEDSMPGELPNVVSGRVANVFNLRGPNFITDAACASALAAVDMACELLVQGEVDAALTGGVDRNMDISYFVKFCKIGALSATGTRPFGNGADGFVMGEGAAAFLLKRLADAERDGDHIYAVIRGVGGASDGKGKGIAAPNPWGQQLAMQRAWENAGMDPASATLVEAHGTSTRVGDMAEVESLMAVFGAAGRGAIGLGSVKSNIGHLKAAAGAAGLLKATLALSHKVLPPTLNCEQPNPSLDFDHSPFRLLHDCAEWPCSPDGTPRRAGVSAYGFGGTNFHAVLEEYVPGALTERAVQVTGVELPVKVSRTDEGRPKPLRGILALGGARPADLVNQLPAILTRVEQGWQPPLELPAAEVLAAPERLVIDFGSREELLDRLGKAQKAAGLNTPAVWKALQPQGIFRGSGPAPSKVAFLFPGQGSQYLNMGRELAAASAVVRATFDEADQIMTPTLGQPLTSFVFVDSADPQNMQQAELALTQTAITQPAVLTLDVALFRLLATYGFAPDVVMGHSLGEYAALIAAGCMPFEDALEAAAARGAEMARVSMADNGCMAAVMAPAEIVAATLRTIEGYVVAANLNSPKQCVIGGASRAVEAAMAAFQAQGYQAVRLPVSHAFHTSIVAPASKPLRRVLDRMHVMVPRLPLVANVTGDIYPTTPEAIKDMLERQIASPVQWAKGLETLYAGGARVFVEVGPKKALKGFTDDVLGDRPDIWSLFSNHPKTGGLPSFNQALCGLYAAGLGAERPAQELAGAAVGQPNKVNMKPQTEPSQPHSTNGAHVAARDEDTQARLRALEAALAAQPVRPAADVPPVYDRHAPPAGSVVISGTGLGLPGREKRLMDADNALRILRGEQFVDLIPARFRRGMLDKNITRLVKGEDGAGHFEAITSGDEVIKLAARAGAFHLEEEYGVPGKLVEALDITSQLAMAAGLEALHEAGLPLVQTYRHTSTGSSLPDRWLLPEPLRDETGVIFASAFPGGNRLVEEVTRYYTWHNRQEQIERLEGLRQIAQDEATLAEIERGLTELREAMAREPYEFDRRFLFRILSMGHSQFAEYIGARGPNTQVNAACASTTQAIGLAEDWIRTGRCRRVIVIAADDVTSESMLAWIGAGFLAAGAAATDDCVEEAALPFDRRRHGLLMGMGCCALVVESEDAVRERGMRAVVELLSSETGNSAFHATRLNVDHITQVMETLVSSAERRFGVNRNDMARHLVFMSHETFTPARGGSASAEIAALRRTFGEATDEIVVSNTKGFTGHPMGVGIEDVIALKILEYGIVPPVPNYKEVDPELGRLNLGRGGHYAVQYALHLAAGFGSQIAMTFTRRIPGGPNRVDDHVRYQHWLAEVSGSNTVELEVVKNVLRLKASGAPGRPPAPSNWRSGTGPALRAIGGSANAGPAPISLPRAAPMVATTPAGNGHALKAEQKAAPVAVARPEPTREPRMAARVEALPLTEPGTPVTATVVEEQTLRPVAQTLRPVEQTLRVSETLRVLVPAAAEDAIAERVLQLVAEKTGYPRDMLELDLDLEADLGVDTVKQAELFVALRTEFNIPKQDNLKLRDYPTLRHVIRFARNTRPEPAVTPAPAGAVTEEQSLRPVEQTLRPVEQTLRVSEPLRVLVPAAAEDAIAERVLQLVAEKTGYPRDMLELDLDLEADLGVDTVKQAELFVALRSEFNIPKQDDMKLRDYPTLRHVINFARTMPGEAGQGKALGVTTEPGDAKATPVQAGHPTPAMVTVRDFSAANRIPRRIPTPVVRPPLAALPPTQVVLNEHSRVIVALDGGAAGQALTAALRERGVSVLTLDPTANAEKILAQLQGGQLKGPVTGVYWLRAMASEPAWDTLDLAAWRALNRMWVKELYVLARGLVKQQPEQPPFLVVATRLDGRHGYSPEGAGGPLGGAVTGFAKAYQREQPGTLVKAVDFERPGQPGESAAPSAVDVAEALLAETLWDAGAVEIGYGGGLRFGIGLEEQPPVASQGGLALGRETVFLITGAAGGITSAIVADLASASGGVFYLLDLAPLPAHDDADVALFRTDKEALKQKLIGAARTAGQRPTPTSIDKQVAAIERQEAALRAVESVTAAGGTAYYRRVDLLDDAPTAEVVAEIAKRHGRLDVVVHAAGLEISRPLADKDPAQFNLVFDVKADGLFNVLSAARALPIGAIVAFSSVAGRFGNAGQTDYSAANDLSCKLVSHLRRCRPNTRAIAIDWTAWGGIGMATRGSIPQIMEMAGIETLSPEAGIPIVRRELTYGDFRGEVVIAGKLGILLPEAEEGGGIDAARAEAWLAGQRPALPMIGRLMSASLSGAVTAETVLDPKAQPFLFDHVIDGTPVLPGVMTTEAFAELASLLAPGYRVAAVADERFERPFKFYRGQPQTLHLSARLAPAASGELLAYVALRSITQPAKPGWPVRDVVHATAIVHLAREPIAAPGAAAPDVAAGERIEREAIYRVFFHGPAYQVLEWASVQGEAALGRMATSLPPNTCPADAACVMAPRLIELCFQTAGLWALRTQGVLALPLAVGSVTTYRQPEAAAGRPLYARVRALDGGARFEAQVVDEAGAVYVSLDSYRTVALPGAALVSEKDDTGQ